MMRALHRHQGDHERTRPRHPRRDRRRRNRRARPEPPTSPSRTAWSPRSARSTAGVGRRSTPTAPSSRPGFVDIHTHYDGQATWDEQLTPSCWHGVTTVVMGNCGVGFAPVAPDRHEWLIGLMEGVEDIPGAALSAGIQWGWESFPEFLDVLDHRSHVHGPRHAGAPRRRARLRHGRAGRAQRARHTRRTSPPWPRSSRPAWRRGPSASRPVARSPTAPSTASRSRAPSRRRTSCSASEQALGELGTGVFELAPAGILGEDLAAPEREMDWMQRLSAAIDRPVTFAMSQNNADPDSWRRLLDLSGEAAARGLAVRPQVHGRTVSLLLGFQTFHPLAFTSAWGAAGLGLLPWREQVARITADPDLAGADRRRCPHDADRPDDQLHAPEPHLRARRPAGLRARSRAQRRVPSRKPRASTSGRCCSV